jgi:hypothetical protein
MAQGQCVFGCSSDDLEFQLKQYFEAEFDNVYDPMRGQSVEDKYAISILESSIKLVNGHYQIDLPWRTQCPNLPDNRQMALRQLTCLGNKLKADPSLRSHYTEIVEGYISNGYAELVSEVFHSPSTENRTWYIPHHVVFHPTKLKPRVVFDCSAEFNRTSLNAQLLSGPDLNNSLVGVLLRFRQGRYAISSDIDAMFHQVSVSPKDRDALRFFWWPDGDLDQKFMEYRMTRFVFGAVCSPCCAIFAMRRVVTDFGHLYDAETCSALITSMYMDDLLYSNDDYSTTVRIVSEISKILQTAGFTLSKWISNNSNILSAVSADKRAPTDMLKDLNYDKEMRTRALGVWWNISSDCFIFRNLDDKPHTRRGILSTICKTYDPLGFVGPIILPAKIILQDLCRLMYDWDTIVPNEIVTRWLNWKSSLSGLEGVSIPRCLTASRDVVVSRTLHHVSDASTYGYGSVCYLRTIYEFGKFDVSMLYSKSRVTPIKVIPVPRLELKAANLSAINDRRLRNDLEVRTLCFLD